MDEKTRMPLQPLTSIDSLRSGDVLLLRGRSELSALIAWTCNDIYSHSAIVTDDGGLMESVTRGIVRGEVHEKVAATDRYYLVDAFRPVSREEAPLAKEDRDRVIAHGESLLGLPYATNELAVIGVIVALRNRVFEDLPIWLRGVLRVAFDMLLSGDAQQMVCSEYVYRSFAECDAEPVGRLAPQIVVAPPPDTSQPWDVDVPKLIEEIRALLGPRKALANAVFPPEGALQVGEARGGLDAESLEASARAVRERLGAPEPVPEGMLAVGDAVLPVRVVNPKGVSPGDLSRSPSHQPLGRLMQAEDWSGA